ncbi:low molecular weight protein arginine phosphatase [Halalkalibacterium ligniniphilum]|uniref:low molecular weight protein arginine phosphatase n=1 Tax=Halalkalibacterium ligniniphilum TaxID=1134413 RepID=UPI00037067F5|nr:low molecular weight protein arginine phosphatase [Halalkalibacterium ligniniphilum]
MSLKRVLFVCTGNTCRSPLAEALLRHKLKDHSQVESRSAGVHAFPGSSASEGTQTILSERGIEMNHSAQPVTEELLDWADVVLTMTQGHKQLLLAHAPHQQEKIFTLKEYALGSVEELDVSDPFGGSLDVYRQTAVEIEECVDKLIENHILKDGR